jgi:Predicted ATPase of the ABC class
MWTVSLVEDPLPLTGRTDLHGSNDGTSSDAVVVASFVARASCSYDQLVLNMPDLQVALEEGGHVASVALADYIARQLSRDDVQYQCLNTTLQQQEKGHSYRYESSLEPLDRLTSSICSSRLALRRRRQERRPAHNNGNKTNGSNTNANGKYSSQPPPPYVLERTDIWCCDKEAKLHVDLRLIIHRKTLDDTSSTDGVVMQENRNEDERLVTTTMSPEETLTTTTSTAVVASMLENFAKESLQQQSLVHHIATVVLQERLRAELDELHAVSFVSNNAILPRKSGASQAPMSSPPAIPFMAPTESDMHHTAHVEMGRLAPFFVGINCNPPGALATTTAPPPPPPPLANGRHETLTPPSSLSSSSTIVSLEGLLIPRGVVLICGGGYHGKSTLLRAIAAGVYNKIPGDGREFCVTIRDAMTIRAEDGRYVNNCNVR